ncbi:MAG: AhpC/TSA family protein [Acidobacteriota bacterium]
MARDRAVLESGGTKLAFVHMGTAEQGERFLSSFGLGGVPHVPDPEREVYRAFGLGTAGAGAVFAPSVFVRAASALIAGHGAGVPVGDVRQMPGAFVLARGRVVSAFRHQTVADRPDYAEMAACGDESCSLTTPGE